MEDVARECLGWKPADAESAANLRAFFEILARWASSRREAGHGQPGVRDSESAGGRAAQDVPREVQQWR